jgi:hypothetical protein
VLVNEPYRGSRTISLPAGYMDLYGVPRTSVTLAGGTGVVLVPSPPAPVPTPTPTPQPPVSTPAPVAPVAPAPPASSSSSGGAGGAKARVSAVGGGPRGAAPAEATRTTIRGGALHLSGRVNGASGGQVRLTVSRKRGGKWVVARRVVATVKRSGSFYKDIPRLPHGTYRLSGGFLGTGTSLPSHAATKTFHA